MNKKPLPSAIPIFLYFMTFISFVWCVVDLIRGHVNHSNSNFDYSLVNAMSFVWLGFGILALCNGIAIHKFNEYLEHGNQP